MVCYCFFHKRFLASITSDRIWDCRYGGVRQKIVFSPCGECEQAHLKGAENGEEKRKDDDGGYEVR